MPILVPGFSPRWLLPELRVQPFDCLARPTKSYISHRKLFHCRFAHGFFTSDAHVFLSSRPRHRGRGTGDAQARELQAALGSTLPLVLDADALTLLAEREELMQAVRSRKAFTLLTPHAGEFARIAPADIPDPGSDPMGATRALAKTLNCSVLLKAVHRCLLVPQPWPSSMLVHLGRQRPVRVTCWQGVGRLRSTGYHGHQRHRRVLPSTR